MTAKDFIKWGMPKTLNRVGKTIKNRKMAKTITFRISDDDHKKSVELANKFGYTRKKFFAEAYDFGLIKFESMDEQAKVDALSEMGKIFRHGNK